MLLPLYRRFLSRFEEPISCRGSQFFKLISKGSKKLIIIYSHVDIPSFKFSQYNTFNKLPFDQLYLNCPENSYYISGVPGLGSTKAETLQNIRSLIKRNNYDSVVHFGNSMGAYGALTYGLDIGGTIIGLAPEALLSINGGSARTKLRNHALARGELTMLTQRLQTLSPTDRSIHLYFGQLDFADLVSAAYLRKFLPKQTVFIKFGPHSLAPFIEQHYGLTNFVVDIITNSKFAEKKLIENEFPSRSFIKIAYDTYHGQHFQTLELDQVINEQRSDDYAHVFLRQRKRLQDTSLFTGLPDRSLNILYHNALIDYNEELWAQIVHNEDAVRIVHMYKRNDTWGVYHLFLGSLLRWRKFSSQSLIKLGVSPDIVYRVEKNFGQKS